MIPNKVKLGLDLSDLPARATQVSQGLRMILGGACQNVAPSPIWDQADANNKCEKICRWNGAKWNGQWKTIIPGKASVCTCCA
jgi:hypothetical protein